MFLKQLLTGKETGGPFFLAWALSVFCYTILWNIISALNGSPVVYPLEALRIIAVPLWQATLLFSSWWRRTIWVLAFFLLALYNHTYGQAWWDPLVTIPILLTPLLIGARQRVWIWALFALYCAFLPFEWWVPAIFLYRFISYKVIDFTPSIFLLSGVDFLSLNDKHLVRLHCRLPNAPQGEQRSANTPSRNLRLNATSSCHSRPSLNLSPFPSDA